jgi:hypothetical protein
MKLLGSTEIEARKNRIKIKFRRRNWNYFVNRVRTEMLRAVYVCKRNEWNINTG